MSTESWDDDFSPSVLHHRADWIERLGGCAPDLDSRAYLESQRITTTGYFQSTMSYFGIVACYFGLLGFPGSWKFDCRGCFSQA